MYMTFVNSISLEYVNYSYLSVVVLLFPKAVGFFPFADHQSARILPDHAELYIWFLHSSS